MSLKGRKRRIRMFYKALKNYLEPSFLICVLVLATAGGGMSYFIKELGVRFKKEPMPLKKPLDALNQSRLGQYKVVSRQKIGNEDLIEALGTREYIQWLLENKNAEPQSSVRYCQLFITYYDVADKQVAHVPDECYMGGGYQRVGNGQEVTFKVDEGGQKVNLPGKFLFFSRKGSGIFESEIRFPILYLFYVNGEYAGTREQTRFILGKTIFSDYSYYSKIEMKFQNSQFGQTVYPDKKEAVKAAEELLGVLVPILEQDHWPER